MANGAEYVEKEAQRGGFGIGEGEWHVNYMELPCKMKRRDASCSFSRSQNLPMSKMMPALATPFPALIPWNFSRSSESCAISSKEVHCTFISRWTGMFACKQIPLRAALRCWPLNKRSLNLLFQTGMSLFYCTPHYFFSDFYGPADTKWVNLDHKKAIGYFF